MKLRAKNNTTIQYILVSNGSPITSPILPPEVFDSDVVDFIKSCPTDIMELRDSLDFLEIYMRNLWSIGYDFQVFNIKDFNFVEPIINSSPQIQVFFLDASTKEHEQLFEKLEDDKSHIRFFHFYNSNNEINDDKGLLLSPSNFIETIIKNQRKILKHLNLVDVEISPSVFLGHKELHEFYYFVPTRTNFFLINRIIGNFGYDESDLTLEQKKKERHIEETSKALKSQHSFERQNLFVNQIKKIDFHFLVAYREKALNPANSISPFLPPLILVVPFHNPDLKDIYGNKDFTDLLQVEQTENYINLTDTKQGFEMTTAGMDIQRKRIKYLDDISFLHSSFSYSPTVRLPLKGKSLYRELSFFRTSVFPNISVAKNRRKLKKTIYKFGKALKELTISSELEKLIKRRNGQIVTISDLPVEWTLIDGIPLSFTHDICRLPETSLHGLMSFYSHNQVTEYAVPKDILKKTLVVLGSDEPSFQKWHEEVYRLSKRDGFSIIQCNCLDDLKSAINKLNPDFLIFDCHGGYDETTRSSYLRIGRENLDGEYVVKNQIFAPLIFLSACGTAPTYGTMNPIANAFFEAGAISVTSTFLPINIDTGSILYLRVLNKLKYAASHVIHKNWLEFICHLIRTSSMNEAYRLALMKKEEINPFDFFDSNVHALMDSLVFSKRRDLYASMDKKVSTLANDERLYYSEVIPEYLLYTNLGRGDLVLFENWKDEFKTKNVC
ncbi:hypothetical protein [uncultured Sunxiuqinia sp.]|uniref:hypothetical protein n=1 Tax=uncultured Sunxiuqinia sp. TaxID=1573825 RepID=UPI002AA7F533|nr:hypothetical protein [uncultured Sunxiuqinia sp.]